MYRNSYPPNPYGNVSPFNVGENSFRGQMSRPRFQSSPRYHSSPYPAVRPDSRSPNYPIGPPRGFQSPPHIEFGGNSPYSNQGFRGNLRFGSPRHYGRGRGKYRDSFSSGSSPDTSCGGNNDIQMYYHPSMTADPWQQLQYVNTSKQNTSEAKPNID